MLNAGRPYPLGATLAEEGGINFALVAPHAQAVDLCLFDASGHHEQQRLRMPACTNGCWHGRLPSAGPGLVYGYRVHGPWAPHLGQRFNPAKVLLDPYAREIVGEYGGEDLFLGHASGDPAQRDARDNAGVAPTGRGGGPLPPGGARAARPARLPRGRKTSVGHCRARGRLDRDRPATPGLHPQRHGGAR